MTEQPRPRTYRLSDLLEGGFAEATAAHEAFTTKQPRGPLIPLSPRLEREIGGFLPVGLTVVCGPPGSSKTALVNQIAGTCGAPALYVTCEMSPLDLLHRHCARVTGTPMKQFRSGEISPSTWLDRMRRTVDAMPEFALTDATCGAVSLDDIREAALATKGDRPHLLVVIDSLHSWVRAQGFPEIGPAEYERALGALGQLASEIGAAIVCIAEQNRASVGTDKMESAAGSRVFEYIAQLVLVLYRDRDAKEDENGEISITVTTAKNRNGTAGNKLDLRFDGSRMRFRDGDGCGVSSLEAKRRNRSA